MSAYFPQHHQGYPITFDYTKVPGNQLYAVPIPLVNPTMLSSMPRQYAATHPGISPLTVSNDTSTASSNTEGSPIKRPSTYPILETEDSVEPYLALPKDMFPPARKVSIDPNDLIDQLCKVQNFGENLPWLLDLEFGVPKSPITRPIPIYNVKYNSIHCKNTPDAIHPGFEGCSEDLKRALLFYYDCIISAWYRSYVSLHLDSSVDNFQSWLLPPMLDLGMCWP